MELVSSHNKNSKLTRLSTVWWSSYSWYFHTNFKLY